MCCVNCKTEEALIVEYDGIYCREWFDVCDWLRESIEEKRKLEEMENRNERTC